MTTITPIETTTPLLFDLITPLHHGATSSGNTSILRTQEVILPDGSQALVPFVSANSLRNRLRVALSWLTIRTLEIEEHSLSKGLVDLLFSGGAVTTTGAETDLTILQDAENLYPALSLLGFAAKSDIYEGTLRATDLMLVCKENVWRLPKPLANTTHATKAAAYYRGEEFGTRHDVANTPIDQYVELLSDIGGTTQMIYDLQVLKPGAQLYGEISLTPAATETHQKVLAAALHEWAGDGTAWLAAKNSAGYGKTRIQLEGNQDSHDWWVEHLTSHRSEILEFLKKVSE